MPGGGADQGAAAVRALLRAVEAAAVPRLTPPFPLTPSLCSSRPADRESSNDSHDSKDEEGS